MRLVKPTQTYINILMSWFNNNSERVMWGGPYFSNISTDEEFRINLKLNELASYVLISDSNELLGFGQFYSRLNKCHLGRLVINPEYRGKGLASTLMQRLITLGRQELGVNDVSLFVYTDNHSAIKTYKKIGFEQCDYPEPFQLEGCLYMVKK